MLVLLCLAAACTGSADPDDVSRPASRRSSPFTAGPPPEGYRPLIAGRGTREQSWGDDLVGTVEPFTVVAPPGDGADSPDAVVVSATGYAGYEGGLAQASAGYSGAEDLLSVGGRRAAFSDGGRSPGRERWVDLVVARGSDLAVRATGRQATKQDLIAVLEQVQPAESHRAAPSVADPPDGLRVLGSVDADMVLALEPGVTPRSDLVPGPVSAHGIAWSRGHDELAVMTLPGRSADLEALAGYARFSFARGVTKHRLSIEGRPAVFLDSAPGEDGSRRRVVVAATAWGDLSVTAARGPDVPNRDQLVRLAASVEKATPEEWVAFVTEAAGGPGLHADEGSVEVARGRAGEVGWLLQARRGMGGFHLDDCLKLSTGRRACASGSSSNSVVTASWSDRPVRGLDGREVPDFPRFLIVQSTAGGAEVRVRTSTGQATADLHPIPGADGASGAVVFVDRPRNGGCVAPSAGPNVTGVEILASDGRVLACIGT